MRLRVLSWNLFHGRDHPANPELLTWRSRLLGLTERDATHAQVNVELLDQFAERLASESWEVAMLQECPPRWWDELGRRCRAAAHGVLTARNPPLLGKLLSRAARLNPDLIASWEGGSNLTLVRGLAITGRADHRLAARPERRALALTELQGSALVANMHLSERPEAAELELLEAARLAAVAANGRPLVLGGDLNLRPGRDPEPFALLEAEHGLRGTTAPDAIDHVLAAETSAQDPRRLDPAWREVPDPTHGGRSGKPLPIRLSDHRPVSRVVEVPEPSASES